MFYRYGMVTDKLPYGAPEIHPTRESVFFMHG